MPGDKDFRFLEKFWSKVIIADGCWAWLGCITDEGYPMMYAGRHRTMGAHIISYELHQRSPVPDGLVLDHLCRNRSCVNPEHLEAVTNAENVLRGQSFSALNARKTHCMHGHELNSKNLYISRQGYRYCSQCARLRQHKMAQRHGGWKALATRQMEKRNERM